MLRCPWRMDTDLPIRQWQWEDCSNLANWCALRYGLRAFVRLRPRPEGDGYIMAGEQSMSGRHGYMQIEMARMLTKYLESSSPRH